VTALIILGWVLRVGIWAPVAALAVISAVWALEDRPRRRRRHVHRPSSRPVGGRGMPIPLGELPPLPLGPWPACLVHDGGTVQLDPVTAEIETEWAQQWRYPVGGWPLHNELAGK